MRFKVMYVILAFISSTKEFNKNDVFQSPTSFNFDILKINMISTSIKLKYYKLHFDKITFLQLVSLLLAFGQPTVDLQDVQELSRVKKQPAVLVSHFFF